MTREDQIQQMLSPDFGPDDVKLLLRHPEGFAPNKTEQAYMDQLALRMHMGEVRTFYFQRFTLRLAHDLRYTPDFFVILEDGTCEFVEVKGFERDDARKSFVVAAVLHPWARFRMVRRVGKTDQFETMRYL